MTAIHGVWRLDGALAAAEAERQAAALARYGRDATDIEDDGTVALGWRRTFLLPEDRSVAPPAPEGRYCVVADVRLTARDALIAALGLGDEAAGWSDTMLVANAVERWDEGAFDRIYGVFAIAAWDRRDRRLLLARDHVGDRPLFFHRAAQRIAFASMPDGLRVLEGVPREVDKAQYARFLRCLGPAFGRSHFTAIERVMPAHYAIVTAGGISQHRYWFPDLTPLRLDRHDDYADRLADELDRAVGAALRGVRGVVGAHLSAGFDSTAVATTAARLLAPRGGRVVAFTATPRSGYVDDRLPAHRLGDESDVAAITAAMHPNIEHVIVARDRDVLSNLDRSAAIYPGPVLNLCNTIWEDAINDVARSRGITIMLEASMGNATISESGVTALYETLRAGRIGTWWTIARGLVRNGAMRWRGVLWNSVAPLTPGWAWWRIERAIGNEQLRNDRFSLLRPDQDAAVMAAERAENDRRHPIERLDHLDWDRDIPTSLANRLAMLLEDGGADLKAMLGEWGIDHRDPTADRRLIEFSLRIPAEHLIWRGEPRALLRRVLADRAPPEVLASRRKGYQSADWPEALDQARGSIEAEIARIELSGHLDDLVDVDRLKRLVADWPDRDSPARHDLDFEVDYRLALLRTISAASHYRKQTGSNY